MSLIDGLDHYAGCQLSHEAFKVVKGTPEAAVFLAALLLHDRWVRRG